METGLRVILLLVALIIVAGILWDTFRSRRKPSVSKKKASKKSPLSLSDSNQDNKRFGFKRQDPSLTSEPDQDKKQDNDIALGKNLDMFSQDMWLANPKKSAHKISDEEKISWDNEQNIKPESRESSLVASDIQKPETFFILNVMAKQPGIFLGKKLIEVFDEVHLYYGEMQIFHRYENADGSGKHMFSLASAIEPGIFDFESLDSYITPGITLFFSPTTRNHSIAAFELMLRTAKILASNLDGELKDQNRRPLTLEGIEKYRQNVRASVQLHKAGASKS